MSIEKVLLSDDREEAYFQQRQQDILKKLREKATADADAKYMEEHKGHCFRCGTASLVEVEKGDVCIDICINKDCGAVHLDPGELDQILKDQSVIKNVRLAIFNVFK
jgi:hypothetical protein